MLFGKTKIGYFETCGKKKKNAEVQSKIESWKAKTEFGSLLFFQKGKLIQSFTSNCGVWSLPADCDKL